MLTLTYTIYTEFFNNKLRGKKMFKLSPAILFIWNGKGYVL